MKAIIYTEYGTPDVLQLKEVETPTPKDDEVLVKVHAASINSWDWDMLRGKPFIVRMWGLLKPKYQIPGADIAGQVEAVGKDVKQFKPGDEVFGDLCECGWGGFAQYVCAGEKALTIKSPGITFEDAASIPQAAGMALQGLRDKGRVQPGQNVMINGAAGSVGSFALQMAKHYGAEVTGVDSTAKLDFMRSLGADHVFDYTREDFVENERRYDLIIDVIAHRSLFDYKRVLSPGGRYIMIGGTTPRIFQAMLLGPLISMTGSRKMGILGLKPNKDMNVMLELIESGKVTPIIDKRYPLSEVAEAFRYFGTGRIKGKIIITVEHP